MILVTGGTGFIGGELVKQLQAEGKPYRLLLNPNVGQGTIPKGFDVNLAISSLKDVRGLRAAMQGVDTIYHLAGVERYGAQAQLEELEVVGIETLTQAAREAHIQRFVYLSYLRADRASASRLMQAKGIAEHVIRNSGIPYTIFRTSLIFGKGDNFTQNLARLIRISPGIVLIPGKGSTLFQPLWIGDLVTCMIWVLEMPEMVNQVVEIGGPEHLSFLEILQEIMAVTGKKRKFVEFNPAQLNWLTQLLESMVKGFPTSVFWMDYLAEDHVCDLDSIPRKFGINPARFHKKLDYLIN
jgi:NADH dehydrogenase